MFSSLGRTWILLIAILLGGIRGAESREPRKDDQDHEAKDEHSKEHGGSELSDEEIPLLIEGMPDRPKPILELGTPYLGSGRIRRGFTLPGGAVWQPTFLLFGAFRTGLGVYDDEEVRTVQWANRLDLFGNLQLSGTERAVFGLRNFDETVENGARRFTGYQSVTPDPLDVSGFQNHANMNWDTVSHLFFEGDFGEIFPNLDPGDNKGLDFGFSVGRQPINFQEGLLINDFVDAVGITRNNLKPKGMVNLRVTGLFAWNQINRNTPASTLVVRNLEADGAKVVGLFTEADWRFSTVALDAVYVRGGTFRRIEEDVDAGDGIYAGLSFVQRWGGINSSIRVVTSFPIGAETPEDNPQDIGNPASRGTLFFGELSWTPHHAHDLIYANAFFAMDSYRAAALDPTIPGPLARAGILFAGTGLGNTPSPLSPTANDVLGGAFGYQRFFFATRHQLLVEGGGRYSTRECSGETAICDPHEMAGGARYQIAVGRRFVVVLDGFAAYYRLRGVEAERFGDDGRLRLGSRIELLLKF